MSRRVVDEDDSTRVCGSDGGVKAEGGASGMVKFVWFVGACVPREGRK